MADDSDPIAIVGMAVRLPGDVSTTADFWDMLVSKRSGLIPIPTSRFNVDGFHSTAARSQSIRNREAYMFDPAHVDLNAFDPSYFTPGEKEISGMDPMQRQLLEIARECLDSAGETNWRGRKIGCYVGSFSSDFQDDLSMDPHHNGIYRGSGYLDFLQPNRVSYEYDWTGPSMLIKTGCSSSMVALHLAAEAVRNGAAESAMALGANLLTSVMTSVIFTETGVLSPSGKCKTFDLLADGYGRGEAVNAVYVKRLSHALRDGNPVRAVIRSSATNNDGRSNGIMSPNTDQQEALIRETYTQAGLPFEETAFFECHGTGTPTGDPLEVAAVARVWGDRGGMLIGAVKPNVGHSEGAAGLTSVIKCVLALENKTIPPNIYCETLNPKIPWNAAKLSVPKEPTAWPAGKAQRVSVNSFGVAGSNAHMILESAESWAQRTKSVEPNGEKIGRAPVAEIQQPSTSSLLLFSAAHPNVLEKQVTTHRDYLLSAKMHGDVVHDLAYTLAHHREHMGYRGYSIVDLGGEVSDAGQFSLLGRSERPSAPPHRRLVYVFTGQGAQWPQMGRELLSAHDGAARVFADSIARLDAFIRALPAPYTADWSIAEELAKDKGVSKVAKRGFSHPCATAVQIALVDLLTSLGLRPEAVIGHSGGEATAAYASGSISAEAAMAVAYFRGWVLQHADKVGVPIPAGTMAAVGLGRAEVEPFLIPGVVVGCENSQVSSTLSGDPVCIQHCVDQIKRRHPDVSATVLDVETSFHSPWIEPLGVPYQKILEPYLENAKPPSIPHFSSVTGTVIEPSEKCDSSYWLRNFVQPVLFDSAMRRLLEAGSSNLFLEVGPHPSLQSPLRDILRTRPEAQSASGYLGTFRRGENARRSVIKLCGELFVHHVTDVDLTKCIPREGTVLTDLPAYPWLREGTYSKPPLNSTRFKHRAHRRHDLLGARVLEGNDIEPAWRNMLDLKEVPWLRDHVVDGQVVFPAACYAAMAGEAVRQAADPGSKIGTDASGAYTIRNMTLATALVVPTAEKVELYTRLIPVSPAEVGAGAEPGSWYNFRIMSCGDGTHWLSHCGGFVRAGADGSDCGVTLEQADADYPREVDAATWYRRARALGIEWKTAFQGMDLITAGTVTTEAAATVYDYDGDDGSRYGAHPVVLDQVLQITLVAMSNGLPRKIDKLMLPTFIGKLAVFGEQDMRMRAYGSVGVSDVDDGGEGWRQISAHAALFSDDGTNTVTISGLDFAELPVVRKRETAMKLQDGRLLLGSYFSWDEDITLAESLNISGKQQPKNDQWRDQHVKEVQRAVSLLGFKIPDARVLEVVDGEQAEQTHDVMQMALEALHPTEDARCYSTYTIAVFAEDAAAKFGASLLQTAPDAVMVSVVNMDEACLTGPLDVLLLPYSVLTSEDFTVQTEIEALLQQIQPGGRVLIHHLGEPDSADVDLKARAELAESRMVEVGLEAVFKTGSGLILATPIQNGNMTTEVTLLTSEQTSPLVQELKSTFEMDGVTVNIAIWDGVIPAIADKKHIIVSLVDLERDPVVHQLDDGTFKPFIQSICELQNSMIWALPAAHDAVSKPEAAMIQGLVRSVRMENRTSDITLLEVDEGLLASKIASGIFKVTKGLADRRKGGSTGLDPDQDFALKTDGTVQISRMKWFPLPEQSQTHNPEFRGDAAYLLAGGMGGLGRSVATWMAEHGVRHFIFLSRSAADPRNDAFVSELRSYPGATVAAISGDVGSLPDVQAAVSQSSLPVAGVLQFSLALRDAATREMTFADWDACVRPRVRGTLNLHEALLGAARPLDFFLVFGSGGGHTGYYGQANYSAANSFLDAFVDHRRALGLAASIIDLGVVGDVGYVLDQETTLETFKAGGFFLLTEADVLQAVALALAPDGKRGIPGSFCLGGVSSKPLTDPSNKVNWKRDVRFGMARHMESSSSPSAGDANDGEHMGHSKDEAVQAVVEKIRTGGATPETSALVAGALAGALSRLTLRPVFDFPLGDGLTAIGLDSIISIELVDWIHGQFGVGMTSMGITQCASLMHLGQKVAELVVAQG